MPSSRRMTALLALTLCLAFSACSHLRLPSGAARQPAAAPAQRAGIAPALQSRVRLVFPEQINNVGEATAYLLAPHAYQPADFSAAAATVARRGFMDNHEVEPVPLYLALQHLLGDDGQLALDRLRQRYTFRLRQTGEPAIAFVELPPTMSAAAGPVMGAMQPHTGAVPAAGPPGAPAPSNAVFAVAGHAAERESTTAGAPVRLDHAPAAEAPTAGQGPTTAGAPARPDHALAARAANQGVPGLPATCYSLQARANSMLSDTVRRYFLGCGFKQVSWKLGKPGRYADYRLFDDLELSLPGGYEELIAFLNRRFGISATRRADRHIEFYDAEQ